MNAISEEHFKKQTLLGHGGFGKVFLVQKECGADIGKYYAMKIINIDKKDPQTSTLKWQNEITIMSNVAKVCSFVPNLFYDFVSNSKCFMVMDFIGGGDLRFHIEKRGSFSANEARFIIAQLTIAIEWIHKLYYVFRDIKPENIMLDSKGSIKLVDFGLAKRQSNNKMEKLELVGTPGYMAPEILRENPVGNFEYAIDFWAMGATLYELMSGKLLFETASADVVVITQGISIPNKDAKDLILGLLNENRATRIDAVGMKKHPFFIGKINWDNLAAKKVQAPFKPPMTRADDTGNFNEFFTKQRILPNRCVKKPTQYLDAAQKKIKYSLEDPASNNHAEQPCSSFFSRWMDYIRKNEKQFKFFEDYSLAYESPIADCSYITCMKGEFKNTDYECVVKIGLRSNHMVKEELLALKLCKGHPNIVELLNSTENDKFSFIVLEYLAGKILSAYVHEREELASESEVCGIFKDIARGVLHMHTKHLVHRDLKLENIKFRKNGSVKISDLSFALRTDNEDNVNEMRELGHMSVDYVAPEVLINKVYTASCDLWSLGVILYTLLCGHTPFRWTNENNDDEVIKQRIRDGNFDTNTDRWKLLSESAKELINRLLTVSSERRFEISDVLAHHWMLNEHDCTPYERKRANPAEEQSADDITNGEEISAAKFPTYASDLFEESDRSADYDSDDSVADSNYAPSTRSSVHNDDSDEEDDDSLREKPNVQVVEANEKGESSEAVIEQRPYDRRLARPVGRPNTPSKFECEKCGLCYGLRKNLLYHQRLKHSDYIKLYVCPECSLSTYSSTYMLKRHLKDIHKKDVNIRDILESKKQIRNTKKVEAAYKVKLNNIPIKRKIIECDKCGKPCAGNGNLNRHKNKYCVQNKSKRK